MAKNHDASVEITFRSADVQPPLFVAGSFSQPPWTPLEMNCVETTAGERIFTKTIAVQPGSTVQYKFRAGVGDWWILDEARPTVTDDLGNRNNVLKVVDRQSVDAEPPLTPPRSPPTPLLSAAAPDVPEKWPVRALQQDLAPPSRSDASTPSFVRTTVEVADSAAQMDQEAPEPVLADEVAGRLGVRRLTGTPIDEVANTAAKVADTAEDLDAPLAVDIGPEFSHELPGEHNANQDVAPLFAYEVAGGYDKAPSESEFLPEAFPVVDTGCAGEPFDPNDPTLERFPSSRPEILQRVRSIGTGLNEDQTLFEGVPPSPVITPGRKQSGSWVGGDPADDALLGISPTATPKHSPKRRPELQGSSSSRDSNVIVDSTPPLQCIVEESAVDGPHRPETSASTSGPNPEIVVHKADSPTSSNASVASLASLASEASETDSMVSADDGTLAVGPPTGGNGQQRSSTPVSLQNASAGIEDGKRANWFAAFLRLLFVDWLGGFFGRWMGRQRA